MDKMMAFLSCLCLFCAVTGALAEESPACLTTVDGTCAMEEGLELLQSKATKVTPDAESVVDKLGEEQALHKENEKNSSKVVNKSHRRREEYEFEKSLLEDSDIEKIRFRARHQDWIDILELYKDGFLKRYHDHDAGTWHLNHKNQLVFNWLKWGAEPFAMQSADNGKTFNSTGQSKFSLKSYVQPRWWRSQFDGSNVAYLQEESKKRGKKEIFADTKAIIRAHASGDKADLDEAGYLAVAMLKEDDEMRTYIHRLADSMNLQILKEGGVSGLLPYYSGSSTYQTLQKLKEELSKAANKKKGVRWIVRQDDPAIALLQVPHHSSSKKHSGNDAKAPHTKHEMRSLHSKQEKDIEKAQAVLKEKKEREKKAIEAAEKAMQESLKKQEHAENGRLAKERSLAKKEREHTRHKFEKMRAMAKKATESKRRQEEKRKQKAHKSKHHDGEKHSHKSKKDKKLKKHLSLLQEDAEEGHHKMRHEDVDFERDLLEESDIEKIRFRAKHDDWIDILDLYKDGFFRRYHDGDVGVWHQNNKHQLVLKWLEWGEEELRSSDDGKTFSTTGKANFTLRSYKQPVWWRATFDVSSESRLQELSQESKKSAKSRSKGITAIIGAHINAKKVDLNEKSYHLIALMKKHEEMKEFIRRVVSSMNMVVVNEGGLNGIVPYYSGEVSYQTLETLKAEITKTARNPDGERWVMDQGGDDPTHAF